jgi:glycosyltransferase involved in cell wall biosynthesis
LTIENNGVYSSYKYTLNNFSYTGISVLRVRSDQTKSPRVLADTNTLILASQSEERRNVILEAMAAGRAAISSDIEGTRELIRVTHNGLLSSPGKADALAQRIEQVYSDPELCTRLGGSASQTVLGQRLTWGSTAQHYFQLYEALAEASPAYSG